MKMAAMKNRCCQAFLSLLSFLSFSSIFLSFVFPLLSVGSYEGVYSSLYEY
jgi:hypothetical protein